MRASFDSTEAAAKADGVIGVLTAADMAGSARCRAIRRSAGRGGAKIAFRIARRSPSDRCMHIGEPVALVVAESLPPALDAAELVAVDYEELPAVDRRARGDQARRAAAVDEHPGQSRARLAGHLPTIRPMTRRSTRSSQSAAHVARITVVHQRMAMAPMETRGATGKLRRETGRYTLRVCSQGAGAMRDLLAADHGNREADAARHHRGCRRRLRHEDRRLSGISGAAGGGQEARPQGALDVDPLGGLHCDNQARDKSPTGELALDENGKFLALRARQVQNLGAYVAFAGVQLATNNFARCFPGMYDIRKLDIARALRLHQHAADRRPIAAPAGRRPIT